MADQLVARWVDLRVASTAATLVDKMDACSVARLVEYLAGQMDKQMVVHWVASLVEPKVAWMVVPKAETMVVYWESQLVVHSAVMSVALMEVPMAVHLAAT